MAAVVEVLLGAVHGVGQLRAEAFELRSVGDQLFGLLDFVLADFAVGGCDVEGAVHDRLHQVAVLNHLHCSAGFTTFLAEQFSKHGVLLRGVDFPSGPVAKDSR